MSIAALRQRHDEYFLTHSPFPVNIVIWLVLKPSVVFGHPATAENAMWARINRGVVSEANVVTTLILAFLPRMAKPSAFNKCTTATHPAAPLGSGELRTGNNITLHSSPITHYSSPASRLHLHLKPSPK